LDVPNRLGDGHSLIVHPVLHSGTSKLKIVVLTTIGGGYHFWRRQAIYSSTAALSRTAGYKLYILHGTWRQSHQIDSCFTSLGKSLCSFI
jgi:hypothetical protein